MDQPTAARLALTILVSPFLIGASQVASTRDGTGTFDFAVCQAGIDATAERLSLPDPIINCGGLPGRPLGSAFSEWHAAGDGHGSRRHRLRCDAVTTDAGYREHCYWEAEGLRLPRVIKPLPLPVPRLEVPKRD